MISYSRRHRRARLGLAHRMAKASRRAQPTAADSLHTSNLNEDEMVIWSVTYLENVLNILFPASIVTF